MRCFTDSYRTSGSNCNRQEIKETAKNIAIALYILVAISATILAILAGDGSNGYIGFGVKQLETAALILSCITLSPLLIPLIGGGFLGCCVLITEKCKKLY